MPSPVVGWRGDRAACDVFLCGRLTQVKTVAELHAAGYVWGDLKPANVVFFNVRVAPGVGGLSGGNQDAPHLPRASGWWLSRRPRSNLWLACRFALDVRAPPPPQLKWKVGGAVARLCPPRAVVTCVLSPPARCPLLWRQLIDLDGAVKIGKPLASRTFQYCAPEAAARDAARETYHATPAYDAWGVGMVSWTVRGCRGGVRWRFLRWVVCASGSVCCTDVG